MQSLENSAAAAFTLIDMIDSIEIQVQGGNGGRGAVSFRREKYVPRGGPDGGRGGRGGDVLVVANDQLNSLRRYRRHRLFRAEDGANGGTNQRRGRNGADLLQELRDSLEAQGLAHRVQVTPCRCIFGCTYGPRMDVVRRWSGEKLLYGVLDGEATITRRGRVRFSPIPETAGELLQDNLPPG